MLKYGFAVLFAALLVWLGTLFRPDLPGDLIAYVVAAVLALLCVRLTGRVGQNNWIAVGLFLVGGAALFWGLNQSWAGYALVMGLGTLAGTLVVLGAGGRAPAHA